MRWLLILTLVACGKKDSGPPCDQVVEHILEVTKQQMVGHDTVSLDHQKAAMVDQCKKRDMPADTRTCLMAATTISEIAKCRGTKTNITEKVRKPRPPTNASVHGPPSGSATDTGSAAGSATSTGSGSGSGSTTSTAGSGSAK